MERRPRKKPLLGTGVDSILHQEPLFYPQPPAFKLIKDTPKFTGQHQKTASPDDERQSRRFFNGTRRAAPGLPNRSRCNRVISAITSGPFDETPRETGLGMAHGEGNYRVCPP
jgi:hypothetical protein